MTFGLPPYDQPRLLARQMRNRADSAPGIVACTSVSDQSRGGVSPPTVGLGLELHTTTVPETIASFTRSQGRTVHPPRRAAPLPSRATQPAEQPTRRRSGRRRGAREAITCPRHLAPVKCSRLPKRIHYRTPAAGRSAGLGSIVGAELPCGSAVQDERGDTEGTRVRGS